VVYVYQSVNSDKINLCSSCLSCYILNSTNGKQFLLVAFTDGCNRCRTYKTMIMSVFRIPVVWFLPKRKRILTHTKPLIYISLPLSCLILQRKENWKF